MPGSLAQTIHFLETQWSGINANKIKGILAEVRFEQYLNTPAVRGLYEYIIPGGWILAPGTGGVVTPPTRARLALIPVPFACTWSGVVPSMPFAAQVLAESYFRQAGMEVYFVKCPQAEDINVQNAFELPISRYYPASYDLEFYKIGPEGLVSVPLMQVMRNFPRRQGLRGLRAYNINRINQLNQPWTDAGIVTQLFWKEYSRYFVNRYYRISASDLDFFIVGRSGRAYPIEFKSKSAVVDAGIGDWFGIDINPFCKLAYFVSLSNNMEALYFVEEVDNRGNTLEWWGIRFTELLKYCFWVPQAGGTAMGGGGSSTVKVPKVVFKRIPEILNSV